MRVLCLIVVGALIIALGGLEWASARALAFQGPLPVPVESGLDYWP